MSIARKIARKQAWQDLPSEARRYGARHKNIDSAAVKASILHACHAEGKHRAIHINNGGRLVNARQQGNVYDVLMASCH